jgi:diguanylate cyclase (GGDEF)-like protein
MNSIDPLTGLLNRFGCLQAADKFAVASTNQGKPYAVIWIDLDRFKRINESFGHPGGDEVIKDIAVRFRNRVSGRAEISRMGGDEFVFLVPQCDRSAAEHFARELASTVGEQVHI